MNVGDVFLAAIANAPETPSDLRDNARNSRAVAEHEFDETYIEFLDIQIKLNARGDEWTERLRQRREALAPFVKARLITGVVQGSDADYYVEINPRTNRVIHWESYER